MYLESDIKKWISECHSNYYGYTLTGNYVVALNGEWAYDIMDIMGELKTRIFFGSNRNFFDYPRNDYKIWLRNNKINSLIN